MFTDDQIDAYMELKWEEVYNWEHQPAPVEYKMYYIDLSRHDRCGRENFFFLRPLLITTLSVPRALMASFTLAKESPTCQPTKKPRSATSTSAGTPPVHVARTWPA